VIPPSCSHSPVVGPSRGVFCGDRTCPRPHPGSPTVGLSRGGSGSRRLGLRSPLGHVPWRRLFACARILVFCHGLTPRALQWRLSLPRLWVRCRCCLRWGLVRRLRLAELSLACAPCRARARPPLRALQPCEQVRDTLPQVRAAQRPRDSRGASPTPTRSCALAVCSTTSLSAFTATQESLERVPPASLGSSTSVSGGFEWRVTRGMNQSIMRQTVDLLRGIWHFSYLFHNLLRDSSRYETA
jgi:hypothetical protein